MWKVFRRMDYWNTLLKNVDSKRKPRAYAAGMIRIDIANEGGSIPEAYNQVMLQLVFGYQEVKEGSGCALSDSPIQVEIQEKKIHPELRGFCDGVILETVVMDRFKLVRPFTTRYELLRAKLAKNGL
jgi:hypothetical protein